MQPKKLSATNLDLWSLSLSFSEVLIQNFQITKIELLIKVWLLVCLNFSFQKNPELNPFAYFPDLKIPDHWKFQFAYLYRYSNNQVTSILLLIQLTNLVFISN